MMQRTPCGLSLRAVAVQLLLVAAAFMVCATFASGGSSGFGISAAYAIETGAKPAAAASPNVIVIPVNGAIGPASADFIVRGLARADHEHAALAVLQLDTPGGLDTSMRQIIKAMLSSPVPVAAYIAPGGARAASAGTYIVYASQIAAMAPGTNLGAATPVQIGMGGSDAPKPGAGPALPRLAPDGKAGGAASAASSAGSSTSAPADTSPALDTQSTETRKQVQDASAYIRGLAQMRGRNADWAERAVREAVSLSAREALEQKVVDLVARDIPDLLRQVDGRTVTTADGEHRLSVAHATVVTLEADWRSRFLAVITDPNVALILLMIGMYGLFFEFANPGFVLPGVVGTISLLVGLFALQLLPINYVGLGLIFLGLAFLIAEAFLPTFGSLGFGGVVAFAIGALMLMDTDVPGFGIPLPMIAGVTLFGALFVFTVSSVALRARRRPVVTGSEALIGSIGVVLDDGLTPDSSGDGSGGSSSGSANNGTGWARVHGERWRVESSEPLPAGHTVRVTARHGLTLTVVPAGAASQQGERR
ncbi:nodulation protein NfeD [Paraburkholderia edwinii]|uniref:Nodulation protein NfeD n=2 Tax=Paraburkholderia edwinii TaxID=2861782 RepID=A0ABX8V062_9BURK|nr:nodulation protein NfeD [Paraburkholderia edwinii]QYD73942.1 nodulation protein NfeD [Paraburkholderia edwinii]